MQRGGEYIVTDCFWNFGHPRKILKVYTPISFSAVTEKKIDSAVDVRLGINQRINEHLSSYCIHHKSSSTKNWRHQNWRVSKNQSFLFHPQKLNIDRVVPSTLSGLSKFFKGLGKAVKGALKIGETVVTTVGNIYGFQSDHMAQMLHRHGNTANTVRAHSQPATQGSLASLRN